MLSNEFSSPVNGERIHQITLLASRLKEKKNQGHDKVFENSPRQQRIHELERENEELRNKYNRALTLLSMYKDRTRDFIDSKGVQAPVEEKPEEVKPQVVNKRSLLMRYMELQEGDKSHRDRSSSSESRGALISEPRNVWKDRLLGLNTSPKKMGKSRDEEPPNEVFKLAETLNSGKIDLTRMDRPERDDKSSIEEISFLLKNKKF
jgi:FtsZ-binding cell division protein ZapB